MMVTEQRARAASLQRGALANATSALKWPAMLGLLLLSRLPALIHNAPIDDEAVYAVVADVMVDGGLPYVDAIERKPPGLFWLYQACFEVAGKNAWLALHALAFVWSLATLVALYRLTRSWFDEETARFAALLFCIFSSWGAYKCLAFNGELIMNLPLAWAALLVLQRRGDGERPSVPAASLFCAGCLLGIAVLLKQPAGIAAIPLGLFALLRMPRARGAGLARAALLTAGFCSVLAAAALRLRTQGILDAAWYWSVGDHDIPHGPTSIIFWRLALERGVLWYGAGALGLTLLCALTLRLYARGSLAGSLDRLEFSALCGLVGTAFIGAAFSGRFYPHYFVQVIPWSCVLAAPAAAHLAGSIASARFLRGLLALHACVYLVINSVGLWPQREPSPLSRFLRAETTQADPIFVWGQNAGLYATSERTPSSRYITTFPLTGYIFGSPLSRDPNHDTSARILPGAWDNLFHDLCARPPAVIIDTEATNAQPKYSAAHFPRLYHALETGYQVALHSPEGIIYRQLNPHVFCEASSLPVYRRSADSDAPITR